MPTVRQRRKLRSGKVTKRKANAFYKKQQMPRQLEAILERGQQVHGQNPTELLESCWSTRSNPRDNYAKMGLVLQVNGSAGGDDAKCASTVRNDSRAVNQRFRSGDFKLSQESRDLWTSELDGGYAFSNSNDDDDSQYIEEAQLGHDANGNVIILSMEKKKIVKQAPAEVPEQPDNLASVLQKIAIEMQQNKWQRAQLDGEKQFAVDCLKTYPALDYKAMSKDLKLNRLQLSPGQIRHKLSRFLKEQNISLDV